MFCNNYDHRDLSLGELLQLSGTVSVHTKNLRQLMTEIYKTQNYLNPSFMQDRVGSVRGKIADIFRNHSEVQVCSHVYVYVYAKLLSVVTRPPFDSLQSTKTVIERRKTSQQRVKRSVNHFPPTFSGVTFANRVNLRAHTICALPACICSSKHKKLSWKNA